jgi:hypothetical protein
VSDNHDEDAQIRASLETLTRQVADGWRQKLTALRAGVDQQIASIEATLNQGAHSPAINTAAKHISHAAAERAKRARQHAEATSSQALAAIEDAWRARVASETAANGTLRAALEDAKNELQSCRDSLATAEHQVRELAAERAELLRRIADVTAAKAAAETQNRHLETVSQKMSHALSQMLREREPDRAKDPGPKTAVSKRAASPAPTATSSVSAEKKPLQFSQQARDAKRVKIRRGITVDLDGIPGELVDLSLGGAQAILRQAVKPNQLVRLIVPTSAGQLVCKGRIVWSVFEQPRTSLSVYRTGVKFTDVDAAALEKFMTDYCEDSKHTRLSSGVA